jgi:hypothetical protein
MARQLVTIAVGVIVVVILVIAGFVAYSASLPHPGKNSIILRSFSICEVQCYYAPPYIYGKVLVNTTVPLSSIRLIINGTNEFWSNYNDYGIGNYTVPFSASGYNQTLSIMAGKPYLVTLVATFQDSSTVSASTVVVANTK